MLNEKTVKMMVDIPLTIINSVDFATTNSKQNEDENLTQPSYLLKLVKNGNNEKIKNLLESNADYKTTKYLETYDEVIINSSVNRYKI
jgi:hypothetical protein